MRTSKVIHVVGCHAEGEVGDVVVGGVKVPDAETLWDQAKFLADDRKLKDFLLNEPRGGVFRHINVLVPPKNPAADIGNIILEPETVPPMSGSNTMCVATVVLETGILPMVEPVTEFTIEMPGGLVNVKASCRDGKVLDVSFTNITSFVDQQGVTVEVPGHPTLTADILFGGDSFVAVDAKALGFDLVPDEARDLAMVGMDIADAANEQVGFKHPTLAGMNTITFCMFANPAKLIDGRNVARQAVAIRPGKIDRSPTGTAVSARLARMHAKGEISVGDEIVFQSPVDSEFIGSVECEDKVADKDGIRPSVRGRAWLTGTRQLMLDPTDPWPYGYRIADTWPVRK